MRCGDVVGIRVGYGGGSAGPFQSWGELHVGGIAIPLHPPAHPSEGIPGDRGASDSAACEPIGTSAVRLDQQRPVLLGLEDIGHLEAARPGL